MSNNVYAANASHSLKGPLNTISLFSQILFEDYDEVLDDHALEILEKINRISVRARQTVEDIFLYERHFSLQPDNISDIELKKITNSILEDLSSLILKKNAVINCKTDILITCDPSLMKVALSSLIENGISYNTSDVPTIEISGTSKRIVISDNGIGIPDEYRNIIFDPFQRLKDVEEDGTGLGLSIARKIIESHHGRIYIKKSDSSGTDFVIEFN